MAIEGRIIPLKDSDGGYIFPETSSQAVYCNDGKTIDEKLESSIFLGEHRDDVSLQRPEAAEKLDKINSDISEINSQLEHIETKKISFLYENMLKFAFGAKGDGVNDDSNAIQKAIDHAHLNNIDLYIPKTDVYYRVTKSIIIYPNMNIISNKAIIYADSGTYGVDGNVNASGYAVITHENTSELFNNLTIKDLIIKVNRNTMHGIYIHSNGGMEDITFDGIEVYNPKWDGILCYGAVPQTGGNTKPYLTEKKSNRRYKVYNCKFINENLSEQTRTGVMIENSHDAIVQNCYARGFHTGFHCEGSSDVSFIGCVGEDNNNDYQRADGRYNADFMIGRSENVTMISCKSRRIDHDYSFTYPNVSGTIYYNSLYIPNRFMKGFKVIGCSFQGGRIYSNEVANNTEQTKVGISFIGCDFKDCYIATIRQAEGEYHEGFDFSNCKFENTNMDLGYLQGFSITDSIFINPLLASITMSGCENGVIANNKFKGGNQDNTNIWKRGQIVMSGTNNINISNNNFLLNDVYGGDRFSISFYGGCSNNIVNSNIFNKKGSYAIYGNNSSAKNWLITNNAMIYLDTSSEKGVSGAFGDSSNIILNNIIV